MSRILSWRTAPASSALLVEDHICVPVSSLLPVLLGLLALVLALLGLAVVACVCVPRTSAAPRQRPVRPPEIDIFDDDDDD